MLSMPALPVITRLLHLLGDVVCRFTSCLRFLGAGRIRWDETFRQLYCVGVKSLPMVLLLSAIGGSVLGLQVAKQFANAGTDRYVGGVIALAMVREIAPLFTALAVAARSGTTLASELASWKVFNQLDALRMLHIHPDRYLVLPRLLALLLATPLLTVWAALGAVFSGMFIASLSAGISYTLFLQSVWFMLPLQDLGSMLLKGLCFGWVIHAVGCSFAFRAWGGSASVGNAAMNTAVWASVWIAAVHFILDALLF